MESLPAFPAGFPTYPAYKLSLARLVAKDDDECAKLFQACAKDGFFMLDVSDVPQHKSTLHAVDTAFDISKEYFRRSEDEKLMHKMDERAMGYKPIGHLKSKRKADSGKGDVMEMFSLSTAKVRDLGDENLPRVMLDHREQLTELADRLQAMVMQLFAATSKALHVSPTFLHDAHDPETPSKTALRFLHSPGQQPTGDDEQQRSFTLPGHQDHGSLAVLFNMLGGLQVLRPGASEDDGEDAWLWIKPEASCAIVILGSPFVEWTGGVFRAAFHRVLYPPGEQAMLDRYSFGLFMKPCDNCSLERFHGSDLVPEDAGVDTKTRKAYADWHAGSIASYSIGAESQA